MDFEKTPMGKELVMYELAEAEQSGDAAAIQRAYEHIFLLCYLNDLDLTEMLSRIEQGEYWPLRRCRAAAGWPPYN